MYTLIHLDCRTYHVGLCTVALRCKSQHFTKHNNFTENKMIFQIIQQNRQHINKTENKTFYTKH